MYSSHSNSTSFLFPIYQSYLRILARLLQRSSLALPSPPLEHQNLFLLASDLETSAAAMQRTPAQPTNLRRRYQAVQDQKQRNGYRSSTNETSLDGPKGLELSMHLPTEPSRKSAQKR